MMVVHVSRNGATVPLVSPRRSAFVTVVRPRRGRAATAQLQQVAPDAHTSSYTRDPELQAALEDLFADTIHKGRKRVPREEIQHHLDRITELGRQLGLNRVRPEWNDGAFLELITTNTTGVSTDSVCTLQRLTFRVVKPPDLLVNIDAAAAVGAADKPNQIKGPLSGVDEGAENGYALNSYFQILSNGAVGTMAVKASYDMKDADPSNLGVTFAGFRVAPALKDAASLALWREALAEANPGMDAEGAIEITFPKKPHGLLKYILMEPDLQLSIGGSGDFLATKRVPV